MARFTTDSPYINRDGEQLQEKQQPGKLKRIWNIIKE